MSPGSPPLHTQCIPKRCGCDFTAKPWLDDKKSKTHDCKMKQDYDDCLRLIEEVNYRQTTLRSSGQTTCTSHGLGDDIKYHDDENKFRITLSKLDGKPTCIDAEKVCEYEDLCGVIRYGHGPEVLPVDDRLDGNIVAQDAIKHSPTADTKRRAKYQAMCKES